MDKNKLVRVYEGGLFPLEVKNYHKNDNNNNDNNNKVINFNNNIIPFFDYVCNERRKEVVACISAYQVKSVKLV